MQMQDTYFWMNPFCQKGNIGSDLLGNAGFCRKKAYESGENGQRLLTHHFIWRKLEYYADIFICPSM
jgi:hypothetical protein